MQRLVWDVVRCDVCRWRASSSTPSQSCGEVAQKRRACVLSGAEMLISAVAEVRAGVRAGAPPPPHHPSSPRHPSYPPQWVCASATCAELECPGSPARRRVRPSRSLEPARRCDADRSWTRAPRWRGDGNLAGACSGRQNGKDPADNAVHRSAARRPVARRPQARRRASARWKG